MTQPHRPRTERSVRLGFVPLIDCAPLAAAAELGIFDRWGLHVRLEPQPGWATVRDKIIYGELDAAHAVCGLPYSAHLGIGCIPSPALVSLVLSLQGNVLILSKSLWEDGVRDPGSFRTLVSRRGRKPVIAMVSRFSAHHFLLRSWLRRGGVDPDRDVYMPVLPPSQMAGHLKGGYLDGYCVGEPWGSAALADGSGVCAATSADLEPGHPEKVLLVHPQFALQERETHVNLIGALLEACAWCDSPANRPALVDMLSEPRWLNLPKEWLALSLCGPYPAPASLLAGNRFITFARSAGNDPSPAKENWIWRNLLAAGVVPPTAQRPPMLFSQDAYSAARRMLQPLSVVSAASV